MQAVLSRLRNRHPGEIARLIGKNIHHAIAALSHEQRRRRAVDLAFDRRWGTDTSRGVSVHDLGIDLSRIEQCNRYDPSSAAMLLDPVMALGIDPAVHHFIDYGAGKGRAMMLAMEMGFARVSGIELSGRLCEIARDNIARFASQHSGMPPVQVIGADAAAFMPDGHDIVAYFYNPFNATVMNMVRNRLEGALSRTTGRVVVIYANPEHAAVFADTPGWRQGPSTRGVATFMATADKFRRHTPVA
ncbi:class I SAM-dependent methyltransferase [Sphingomonas sp. ERG5]|uniref:class I SAM-dependent methyltransferase n=1 Tax=Sphingomonas sp. ERG5 TaxID=1381597 RepID=UPI00054C6250|nr:class I SAM-dependent methyltransferase [Sphingomonas sp. ERG5]